MLKVLKWFALIFIIAIVGMIGAYYLAKKYEAPVTEYIVKRINERLNAPVHVSDINFSFLERFPSASLVMDSVWAEENIVKIGEPDTLFFFRKVYLNLNIFDMVDGKYSINEIETKDGFLNLLIDEKGYDNFHIWKTSEDTSGFLLELNRVHIENGRFRYQNHVRRQDIQLLAKDLWFKGSFSKDDYTMAVDGEGFVDNLILKDVNYLKNRDVAVVCDLDINTPTETYAFRKGQLLIDKSLDFNISGKFEDDGIDLRILGNDLDIVKSIALLPLESRATLDDYTSRGKLTFDCTLKGAFGRMDNPRMQIKFQLLNGSITKKGSNWQLTDLNGTGSVDNGSNRRSATTEISLADLTGQLNGQPFETKFSLVNLDRPSIEGNLKLNADLNPLTKLLQIEMLDSAKGSVSVDAYINTTVEDIDNPKPQDFLNAKARGVVNVSKARIKLKDDDRAYMIDSSNFSIVDNTLEILDYTGSINQTSVVLSGTAQHFLEYVFSDDGRLDVIGDIRVGKLDLQALFPNTAPNQNTDRAVIAFPQRASWSLNILADEFINGKFKATEVSGVLTMNQFKAEASSLHFSSMGGQVQGRAGVYRFGENQFGLKTDFRSSNIDITDLFVTFNDFEQKFITSEHISGNADADVIFQAFCDSTMNIDTKSIVASADLQITDGELIEFAPLISAADAIKKKPMMRLFVDTDELKKRMQTVKFDTLQNEISIKDETIKIPNMEIRSSAIDLNVSGSHTFNNEIDYTLDFALSELLELEDRKEPYNEFVRRDDKGRTRMFLHMYGTTDDFEIDLERTNVKSTIKDEMISEKNEIKGILKEEFNAFQNDSTAVYNKPEKKEVEIVFDPDGNLPKGTIQPTELKPKDQKVLNKLIKKTESNKKKLEEGAFDDDDF